MKTKKFYRKLALNKATVANLNDLKMQGLMGGAPLTSFESPDRCGTKCPTGVCCPILTIGFTECETLDCCINPATVDANCISADGGCTIN